MPIRAQARPAAALTPAVAAALLAAGLVAAAPAPAGAAVQTMASAVPLVPPGVSRAYASRLRGHSQVVVAMGGPTTSDRVVVSDWARTARGWERVGRWSGYVGLRGWSAHHREGDLHTPEGVYSLTNAAGYDPDPGTRLPYQHDPGYYALIDNGVRTFAYVIEINYNHVPGTPPSDRRRPAGVDAGGDIWLHVAHRSGTHGCVSIGEAGLRATLRWLRPATHPVIIMGPRSVIGS